MVVIREHYDALIKKYGKEAVPDLEWFSGIIGFSIDTGQDTVKVELNPDRPDLYSFSTIFSAIDMFRNKKNHRFLEFQDPLMSLHVSKDVLKLRSFILCFSAHGNELSDNFHEIIDYQEKLHQTVGKNRVKFAIGIHDLKTLKPPFRYVSMDRDGIRFTTYDGKITGTPSEILEKHELGAEYSHLIRDNNRVPLILDSVGNVLSMPPVINGSVSRISESTREIFVDITGDDWVSIRSAYYLLANYLRSIGFTVHSVKQDLGFRKDLSRYNKRKIMLPLSEVREILGIEIPTHSVENLLERMGYLVSHSERSFSVLVPGSRIDVMGPVDVIEDVGKAYGYDNVPGRKPELGTIGTVSRTSVWEDSIRTVLVGMGLQEIDTFFLQPSSYYEDVNYLGSVEIINPKSIDFSVPRDRLLFGMLDFFRFNKRRKLPQEIFEIGKVVIDLTEKRHLCIGITNSKAGFSDIKRIIEPFFARLNVSVTVKSSKGMSSFIPGRVGSLIVDGKDVGIMGEIHPELLEKFELPNPVAVAEIDLDRLNNHNLLDSPSS